MNENETDPEVNLVFVGTIVEGGLAVVALLLAWFGLFDHQQVLREIEGSTWWLALRWGTIAAIPLIVYLGVFHFWQPRFFEPMRQFVVEAMYPVFRESSLLDLLLLSLMAGFCEEMLFRWSIQGGLTSLLEPRAGMEIAQIIGLGVASILFGLCHWVNAAYGLTTLAVGLFLGLTMIWTGTFLVPAVAHALFDFVALIYIAKMSRVASAQRIV